MIIPIRATKDIALLEACHELSHVIPATPHWLHEQWVLHRKQFTDFDHFSNAIWAVALIAAAREESFERAWLTFLGIDSGRTDEPYGLVKVFQANSPAVL